MVSWQEDGTGIPVSCTLPGRLSRKGAHSFYGLFVPPQAARGISMRILLAEDDRILHQNLKLFLQREGYAVDACFDGEEALYYCREGAYDCILLDRMLPQCSGTEVLKQLRKEGISTPVLFLTALGTLADKVEGLDMGADDYLVKPFALEELSARIRSLTRRSGSLLSSGQGLSFGDLLFQPVTGELSCKAGRLTLSKREGALLEVFLRNPEQTLSRGQLLHLVWGPDGEVEDGNLDNYIFFLRRRLKNLHSAAAISTIRGIGYRITAPSQGGD